MKAAALALSVLTFNVAGPRRVQQAWEPRRAAIAAKLKAEAVDVAAFQDLWRADDRDVVKEAAGHGYAAADEMLGLAVTSRLPIESFASRDLGDGWGVLRARVRDGKNELDVYSTRLEPGDGPAGARRLGRLFRLAEFIRAESSTRPFVLLGDLGIASDERAPTILLDLLEARDLCVSHGDEVCGRTWRERRVDYVIIPYSSWAPREYARTALTDLFTDDEEAREPHFGLRARLDPHVLDLRPAAHPPGRDEALAEIENVVDGERQDAEKRMAEPGWLPFAAALRYAEAQDEAAGLVALEEAVRSARLRGTKRAEPTPLE